ncbi:unnamed protein product [Mytilus edulis]|uniref:Ig-like domain-containing protein n=1 Tax=Mytilus edulis TaxID=6550 RepID=A0A8S3SHX8_MYTED|nr:unnamed protein product [Mytilus edulis]
MINICATVLAVLLSATYSVILGKSDKIVKPGETIVLGCINGTDDTIWSYRRNINDNRITLMDALKVNPKYKEKVKLTSKGSAGEYCLNIINVSSQYEGVYYRFTNAQNSILQFNLAIEAAPDGLIILNKTTNGIIIETEDKMLNVTCQAIGGNTKGNIYWRNVSDFEPHFTELDEWPFAYLHFTTDYKHHKINLSCVVEHAMLIVPMVTSVIFNIRYKPKITISRYPAGVIKEGQGIQLECLDKSNPPKANITWVKDGIILSSDPIYEKTNMKTNDSGSYSCIVFNSLGKEVQEIVIFVNKRNGSYNDDFLDLKRFLCFGIFTLSFVLLVASAICNICIHLHCKKLSRVSSLTVNNDVSRVNIEMTDINNGYHTINEEDIRQEDNEDENQAEIQSTNDLSLIDFDGQSSELDADETGLRESNDYVNPYCTMIQDTVEVHIYKTSCARNSDSDNTAVNLNTELQRSQAHTQPSIQAHTQPSTQAHTQPFIQAHTQPSRQAQGTSITQAWTQIRILVWNTATCTSHTA